MLIHGGGSLGCRIEEEDSFLPDLHLLDSLLLPSGTVCSCQSNPRLLSSQRMSTSCHASKLLIRFLLLSNCFYHSHNQTLGQYQLGCDSQKCLMRRGALATFLLAWFPYTSLFSPQSLMESDVESTTSSPRVAKRSRTRSSSDMMETDEEGGMPLEVRLARSSPWGYSFSRSWPALREKQNRKPWRFIWFKTFLYCTSFGSL